MNNLNNMFKMIIFLHILNNHAKSAEENHPSSSVCAVFLEQMDPELKNNNYFWQDPKNYCHPVLDLYAQLFHKLHPDEDIKDSPLIKKLVASLKIHSLKWNPQRDFTFRDESNFQYILSGKYDLIDQLIKPLMSGQLDKMIHSLDDLIIAYHEKAMVREKELYSELKNKKLSQQLNDVTRLLQQMRQDFDILNELDENYIKIEEELAALGDEKGDEASKKEQELKDIQSVYYEREAKYEEDRKKLGLWGTAKN